MCLTPFSIRCGRDFGPTEGHVVDGTAVYFATLVTRFRAVPSTSYVAAIIVLYLATFVMGAWIYTQYRFTSRLALEQLQFFKTVGTFEMKEHVATIGLIVLPAYWAFWRQPLSEDCAAARKSVTLLLAIIVWANFLIGHIANNARGFGS